MRFPDRWDAITYLSTGTERQQQAYRALTESEVMSHLSPWSPTLVGTIPLGIDLPASDLDILCQVWEPEPFTTRLHEAFGHLPDFSVESREVNGFPVILARFTSGKFPFEIFGQARPVVEQNGYQHMVVEARLLALAGQEAAAEIRRLKVSGLKTEPAFAHYFGLEGDPYLILRQLFAATDAELRQIAEGRAPLPAQPGSTGD